MPTCSRSVSARRSDCRRVPRVEASIVGFADLFAQRLRQQKQLVWKPPCERLRQRAASRREDRASSPFSLNQIPS
ncbi:hypothetical protein [Nostoc sp. MG11]|uniref:hypothetical protein n=1 Tax=Nostoc sp. MG11 TaxID=2721166 RepID=UPI0018671EBA|nr:hypothetical protein [Nostoc sp. MG11]